jgi:hypothetical protein
VDLFYPGAEDLELFLAGIRRQCWREDRCLARSVTVVVGSLDLWVTFAQFVFGRAMVSPMMRVLP